MYLAGYSHKWVINAAQKQLVCTAKLIAYTNGISSHWCITTETPMQYLASLGFLSSLVLLAPITVAGALYGLSPYSVHPMIATIVAIPVIFMGYKCAEYLEENCD